jgi:hypothetical protein
MDKYAAHVIEKHKVAGTTQAVLNDQIQQLRNTTCSTRTLSSAPP